MLRVVIECSMNNESATCMGLQEPELQSLVQLDKLAATVAVFKDISMYSVSAPLSNPELLLLACPTHQCSRAGCHLDDVIHLTDVVVSGLQVCVVLFRRLHI